MGRFQGKIAVVTGGNSGIGFGTAEAFIGEGAQVVVVGRNAQRVAEAAAQLGPNATGIRADISRPDDISALFADVKARFGRVDALFANAGVAQFATIGATTPEFFDNQFNTNVRGLYFTIRDAVPLMPRGSAIVVNASVAAQLGFPHTSVYSATKAAVRSLARTLSAELLPLGIRVNSVSPGPIETPIFGKLDMPAEAKAGLGDTLVAGVPQKRMGTVAEVAAAVLFLASADASYTIGADLVVDGGMTQL
ncbi:MAG: SDR family oxidoreductase [Candidatus Sumerlaeia bacterium]|nr:SDR family oxidoreductase [Candidatus Sumerlaeia bacterium]